MQRQRALSTPAIIRSDSSAPTGRAAIKQHTQDKPWAMLSCPAGRGFPNNVAHMLPLFYHRFYLAVKWERENPA